MYKRLCSVLSVILATLAFMASRSDPANFIGGNPRIIKRVVLKNQNAAIPSTTLFTPSHDGIYRVSAYMAQTKDQAGWVVSLAWSDDGGAEALDGMLVSEGTLPPDAYETAVSTIEAVAGQPVTFNVNPNGGDISTYSLYFVVEQLD